MKADQLTISTILSIAGIGLVFGVIFGVLGGMLGSDSRLIGVLAGAAVGVFLAVLFHQRRRAAK